VPHSSLRELRGGKDKERIKEEKKIRNDVGEWFTR
jgi:hypothetical protein